MQLPTYAIARAGSVTYTPVHGNIGALAWARPGIEPMSSWILTGFSPLSHDRNSYLIFKWSFARAICPYFSDSFKTHLYKNKQCHIVLIWLFCVILVEYSFGFFFFNLKWFFSFFMAALMVYGSSWARNLGCRCHLHQSCENAGSFNPLHQARDWTNASTVTPAAAVGFWTHCATRWTPNMNFLIYILYTIHMLIHNVI